MKPTALAPDNAEEPFLVVVRAGHGNPVRALGEDMAEQELPVFVEVLDDDCRSPVGRIVRTSSPLECGTQFSQQGFVALGAQARRGAFVVASVLAPLRADPQRGTDVRGRDLSGPIGLWCSD